MTDHREDPRWRVVHGDCLDVLRTLDDTSVDAVVTDPPYGINTKSDGMGKLNPWADICNAAMWYREWIGECRRVLKPAGSLWSFLNWRSLPTFMKAACDLGWPIESLAVWNKEWIGPGGVKGLRPSYEMIALWAMPEFRIPNRSTRDVFSAKWSAHKPHGHPAEKPEAAIDYIFDAVELAPGSLVVDPFLGSGTVGAVCKRRGFAFIGCELDESWIVRASQRIEAAAGLPVGGNAPGQRGLFEEDAP